MAQPDRPELGSHIISKKWYDSLARKIAREMGAKMTGVLGELLHAKKIGHVESVRDEISRLRDHARFFVSREIELIVLAEAGELPR